MPLTVPRLNYAHVCENAFLSQTGNMNIIGNFNQIQFEKFPANYIFFIVTSFIVVPEKIYTQEISIINKDNRSIIKPMQLEQAAKTPEIGSVLKINAPFEEPGLYKVVIKLSGEVYQALDLNVHQTAPQG